MPTRAGISPEENHIAPFCIHHFFENQVLLAPDDLAICFEGQALSYGELNRKANQLAYYLIARGVGPEILVGLYVERSLEMVIGLLGILKAGAAYVPLDPIYPADRRAFMLRDAGVDILLTQASLSDDLPEFSGTVITLDADWEKISAESTENPSSAVRGENLAYVIYTSGSTGLPKGVQLQHEGVVSFLRSMAKTPGLSRHDVLLAVTIITFDIAAMEVFLPLSVGARIFLVSRQTASDGYELMRALEDSDATAMQATSATWQLLLESGWRGKTNLKMLCGGEAMTRVMANQLYERGASLWNMYGPTETTIWSSVLQIEPGEKPVPVGPPIDNTEFHILDAAGQPVADGAEGELFIGGIGLARGYLNRPELNAEKFIQNPFSPDFSRLYRTGDLVRTLPDGNLEFFGRIDHQFKLRGFRIELGEIEAVLLSHPGIKDAAVVGVEDKKSGDKSLVAYLVRRNGTVNPRIHELRALLSAKLPAYMIPAVFVFLAAFPRLPNGKLDRRSLPETLPNAEADFLDGVSDLTETEQIIRELWQQVLGHQQFGLDDNFFELGGNSLLAVRLFAEMKRKFSIQLAPALLLEVSTIRQLSQLISSEKIQAYTPSSVIAIQPQGSRVPVFCINGIYGDVISFHQLAFHMGRDQPIYGLQMPGFDVRTPYSSVEEVAAQLLRVLREARPSGPYYLVGFSFGAYVAYEMALRLHEENEKVPLLCLIDTYAPLAFSSRWKNLCYSVDCFSRLPLRAKPLYLRNALVTFRRVGMQSARRAIYNLLPSRKVRELLFSEERKRYLIEENYCARKARFYAGKLTIFRSEERVLQWKFRDCIDQYMGWSKLADNIDMREISGLHTDVLKEPNAAALAHQLVGCLAACAADVMPSVQGRLAESA